MERVTYRYPDSQTDLLRDFSAHFESGEIVAVSGKNGCGKTTLTKLMVGILRPLSGRILINGQDTAGLDLFEIGRKAGYLFQNPNKQLFCDNVYREITFGPVNLGLPPQEITQRAEYYLDYFRLAQFRDDYPGKLSQGEKQRVMLAAILCLGTDYLILDEPTTGLDIRTRQQLGQLLQKIREDHHKGIVLVSHEESFVARYADRELVMKG